MTKARCRMLSQISPASIRGALSKSILDARLAGTVHSRHRGMRVTTKTSAALLLIVDGLVRVRAVVNVGRLGAGEGVRPDAGCSTDDDCNLNGICKDGVCVCVPEWTGNTCGELNLLPARPRPFSGYDEIGASSWGGSIAVDPEDSGLWHMYVSRMAGNCGLNSWQQNSEIIHATSTDPEGPYKYNSTVLPHFAHGPKIRKLKEGYLLMHLGCGVPFKPYVNTCKNGTSKPPKLSEIDVDPICNQFNVSVMTSNGVNGPWSASQQVFLSAGAATQSWYVPSGRQFSNPAPVQLSDGTILCAYRADARSGGEHVSLATASSINGPYEDARSHPAVSTHTGEDPVLWQDERSHWHMLMHNMGGGVGSHAYSRDAKNWTRSDIEPYTAKVVFSDNTSVTMHRRERPELVLSATGQPRYFSSGVEDYSDHTYTLVMKVKAD